MWKIVLVLLATALFILIAHLVFDPPLIQMRVGASEMPPLMYGGIRG
ncbi:MAG: hypothetical protein WA441_01925 [Methyloceanibacter sp.]